MADLCGFSRLPAAVRRALRTLDADIYDAGHRLPVAVNLHVPFDPAEGRSQRLPMSVDAYTDRPFTRSAYSMNGAHSCTAVGALASAELAKHIHLRRSQAVPTRG